MSRLYQPNVDVYRYVVMRPSVVDLLDRLEPRFLGKPKRRLLLWFAPDSRLESEERYSLRLYLRVALGPALAVDAFIILAMLAPLVYLWHRFPGFMREAILHHGEAHALLIGFLVKQQIWFPWSWSSFSASAFCSICRVSTSGTGGWHVWPAPRPVVHLINTWTRVSGRHHQRNRHPDMGQHRRRSTTKIEGDITTLSEANRHQMEQGS